MTRIALSIAVGSTLCLALACTTASPPSSSPDGAAPLAHLVDAEDGIHRSDFGYHAEIPETWMLMNPEMLAENADSIIEEGERAHRRSGGEFAPAVTDELRDMIRDSSMEFFVVSYGVRVDFADNVNALVTPGQLPPSQQQMKFTCAALPSMLGSVLGLEVEILDCDLATIGPHRAFYFRSDGAGPGTVMAQYQLQIRRNEVLVVTATAQNETMDRLHEELDAFVASIEF